MSKTVRCPSVSCWPHYDMGQLAFDGFFMCRHCGAHMDGTDFARRLREMDEELVTWRAGIAELLAREELQP